MEPRRGNISFPPMLISVTSTWWDSQRSSWEQRPTQHYWWVWVLVAVELLVSLFACYFTLRETCWPLTSHGSSWQLLRCLKNRYDPRNTKISQFLFSFSLPITPLLPTRFVFLFFLNNYSTLHHNVAIWIKLVDTNHLEQLLAHSKCSKILCRIISIIIKSVLVS